MKKVLLIFFISTICWSCSRSDDNNTNCNFLLNIGVNTTLNLNLPQYSQLQFVSNSVYVPNQGNGGLIVINTGTGYAAYDAADPNHSPSPCSILQIEGVEGTCGCQDDNTYSLFTGQPLNNPNLRCGLKMYRVFVNGNELQVTN